MKLPPFDITITPSTEKKTISYSHTPLIRFSNDYSFEVFRNDEPIDIDQDLWNQQKIISVKSYRKWFYGRFSNNETAIETDFFIGDSLQRILLGDYLKGKRIKNGEYEWTPSIVIDDCFICLQNYIDDNYPTIVRYRYFVDKICEKVNEPQNMMKYEFSFAYDAIEEIHVYHNTLVKLDKSWTDSPLKANISGIYKFDVSSDDKEIGLIYKNIFEAVQDKIARFYPVIVDEGRIIDETDNRCVVSRISGVKCKSVTINQTTKNGIKGATILADTSREIEMLNRWIADYLLDAQTHPIIYVKEVLNALFSLINRNSSRSVGIRELLVYTANYIEDVSLEEINKDYNYL